MINIDSLKSEMLKRYESRFITNENTVLTIEGFPRSANTFAVDMLNTINPTIDLLSLAHHTHDKSNLILAVALGKPCVCLIRKPEDAILSFVIYSQLPVSAAFQKYVGFYQELLPFIDSMVVADFDTVTKNFNEVISQLNKKFELELAESSDLKSDAEIAKQKDEARAKATRSNEEYIRTVGAPNEEREKLKQKLRSEVAAYIQENSLANKIYDSFFE